MAEHATAENGSGARLALISLLMQPHICKLASKIAHIQRPVMNMYKPAKS